LTAELNNEPTNELITLPPQSEQQFNSMRVYRQPASKKPVRKVYLKKKPQNSVGNKKQLSACAKEFDRGVLSSAAFDNAKAMCTVLKATHHLEQVSSNRIPRMIGKQSDFLAYFPKAFAPTETLKKQFRHIADQWSKSICSTMEVHYSTVRNESLNQLEDAFWNGQESWEASKSLALKWTRNQFKISPSALREGLDLLEMARKKNKSYFDLAVNEQTQSIDMNTKLYVNAATSQQELPNCSTQQEIRVSIVDLDASNETPEITDSYPSTCSTVNELNNQTNDNNSFIFSTKQKKNYKIPDGIVQHKLLITDETFVGPVSSDFFHLTLPKCNVWDLYHVFRNSTLNPETSLILVHIGYKSVKQTTLRYLGTIIGSVKTKYPNAKIMFTNLFSEINDSEIIPFNEFCKSKYPENFLEINCENLPLNNIIEKSNILFFEWNKKLTHLN
jgi:hypothetical protein